MFLCRRLLWLTHVFRKILYSVCSYMSDALLIALMCCIFVVCDIYFWISILGMKWPESAEVVFPKTNPKKVWPSGVCLVVMRVASHGLLLQHWSSAQTPLSNRAESAALGRFSQSFFCLTRERSCVEPIQQCWTHSQRVHSFRLPF